jgi:hypothetical protein
MLLNLPVLTHTLQPAVRRYSNWTAEDPNCNVTVLQGVLHQFLRVKFTLVSCVPRDETLCSVVEVLRRFERMKCDRGVTYQDICKRHLLSKVWFILSDQKFVSIKKKLHCLSPRANYTDRETAACRRSDCQLLRIEGATWSAWRIPKAVFSVFQTGAATFLSSSSSVVLTRLSGPRSRPTTSQKIW